MTTIIKINSNLGRIATAGLTLLRPSTTKVVLVILLFVLDMFGELAGLGFADNSAYQQLPGWSRMVAGLFWLLSSGLKLPLIAAASAAGLERSIDSVAWILSSAAYLYLLACVIVWLAKKLGSARRTNS